MPLSRGEPMAPSRMSRLHHGCPGLGHVMSVAHTDAWMSRLHHGCPGSVTDAADVQVPTTDVSRAPLRMYRCPGLCWCPGPRLCYGCRLQARHGCPGSITDVHRRKWIQVMPLSSLLFMEAKLLEESGCILQVGRLNLPLKWKRIVKKAVALGSETWNPGRSCTWIVEDSCICWI